MAFKSDWNFFDIAISFFWTLGIQAGKKVGTAFIIFIFGNYWPQDKTVGTLIGIFAVLFLIYEIFKDKKTRQRNLFILLWFFSPAIMFILGQHNAPWFYIGRPASAILIGSYLISKIRPR